MSDHRIRVSKLNVRGADAVATGQRQCYVARAETRICVLAERSLALGPSLPLILFPALAPARTCRRWRPKPCRRPEPNCRRPAELAWG
jgi:hypothetical protein